MTLTEALTVLGVAPGTPMAEVRTAYRALVRSNHPDVVDRPLATERTARVTTAFATVRSAVLAGGAGVVPEVTPTATDLPEPPARPAPRWSSDQVAADAVDGDTIAIEAPAAEAFALLLDAAATVGSVGYVDRHLGILEVLVRFEGGPTCSVLITLQGRAFGTDAFCTIDSIEATPAPPIRPVVEALVGALTAPG
ncbi:MAG: hypothetical protein MUE36_06000 [Acidimicrobiales bacterium]|nr:hypothetical protein [Acidimicrobiales bacterium]